MGLMVERKNDLRPVPDYPRSWVIRPRASKTTFYRTEGGVAIAPVEIDYGKIGWSDGDPRIVAMNMIGSLLESPLVIKKIVDIAGKRLTGNEDISVVDLCKSTMVPGQGGYKTFEKATEPNTTVTARLLALCGFYLGQPLISVVSSVASDGASQQNERTEALESIGNLINLRGEFLSTVLRAYKLSLITLEELERGSELLTEVSASVHDVFQNVEARLRAVGIFSLNDEDKGIEIDEAIASEIKSGLRFLEQYYWSPDTHLPPEVSGTSDFVETSLGDRVLLTPGGRLTARFPGAVSRAIVFVDGSTEEMHHEVIVCPFPGYATRGKK